MRSSPRYIIIDEFFPHLLEMLDHLKARGHWTPDEHPDFPNAGNWPGKRSLDYLKTDPVLSSLFMTCAREFIPSSFSHASLCTHYRYGTSKDWVHTDQNLCTGIVYLSETNSDSGTLFFDNHPDNGGKVILDVPFVQNRFVLFYGDPYHCSKSNYGQGETDSRFTMNFFAY